MKELLAESLARIALLESQVTALQRLVVGLALSAPDKAAFDMTAAMTEFARVHAQAKYGDRVADAMLDVTRELRVLANQAGTPLAALASEALLYGQAGDQHRAALRSWIETAGEEELADDIRQSLRQSPPAASEPGGGA